MNEESTKTTRHVERLARELPRDIPPATDLWPEIEARLDTAATVEPNERRIWPQASVAAILLVATSSLMTSLLLRDPVTGVEPIEPRLAMPASTVEGLRSPELLAISALSEKDRDILITNLDIVRATRVHIEHMLAKDPTNTSLHNFWLRVYEQELELLNEATWTTNGLAERVKT